MSHHNTHVSRQRAIPLSVSGKANSKELPTVINLPLSADRTYCGRQCQGRKFGLHHYLLITVFVQARSVRGNRWCVWQRVQHQTRSALVRVDMCPDHKAQTCTQVTNLCLQASASVRTGHSRHLHRVAVTRVNWLCWIKHSRMLSCGIKLVSLKMCWTGLGVAADAQLSTVLL